MERVERQQTVEEWRCQENAALSTRAREPWKAFKWRGGTKRSVLQKHHSDGAGAERGLPTVITAQEGDGEILDYDSGDGQDGTNLNFFKSE